VALTNAVGRWIDELPYEVAIQHRDKPE